MIEITYSRNNGGHRLEITGHSGYAPHGQDIVCAGVSAIAYALCGYLAESGALCRKKVCSGDLVCCCARSVQSDAAYEMALNGFEQIANSYAGYVAIKHI